MKATNKMPVHFAAKELTGRVHPILINLIGAGGTGSRVLGQLADMNTALIALGHPGLDVRVFDADTVSDFNRGRQRFARSEIGLPKATVIINRINRFYGTYWKAMLFPFASANLDHIRPFLPAQITISCVDTVKSRFDIEDILKAYLAERQGYDVRDRPLYWMDFGNTRYTGQVQLSTLGAITQPKSSKYQPVSTLSLFTEEYRQELQATSEINEPSCSMAQALNRQDLFVNPILAQWGCRLLWTLLAEGWTAYRGVFVNLIEYKSIPIPVISTQDDSRANTRSKRAA